MIRNTFVASLGALALFLGGCGDDTSDDTGVSGPTTGDPTVDPTVDPTEEPTTVDPTEEPTTDPDSSSGDPVACVVDVCATYGAAVPAVAGQIVDIAAADPLFEADFAPLVAEGPAAVDAFKLSLANFISDAYGCTEGAYTGPTMVEAHTGLAITQAEYDAFISIIVDVLTTNGVPEDDISFCFAPTLVDPAFVETIVGL